MSSVDNQVTMSLASYNAIKNENTKFNLFIDRVFEEATLENDSLCFNIQQINDLIHLIYPDRYKKKLSTLRGLDTKLQAKLRREEKNEDNADKK